MKETKNNTINLRKKAYWLMKTLEKECVEEAKVSFDDSTFLSFINWALEEGFLDIDIQSSIKRALLRCHCESVGESIINHSECIIELPQEAILRCSKILAVMLQVENSFEFRKIKNI